MKNTTTITLKLTDYQVSEIKRLGKILWSGQSLTLPEVCRRVLLDGADGLIGGEQLSSEPDRRRLLDVKDLPTGGSINEDIEFIGGKWVVVARDTGLPITH